MINPEWNKFDTELFKVLNYVVALGWLIPIWSPVYKINILLTWIGCLALGLLMSSIKKDVIQEKSE